MLSVKSVSVPASEVSLPAHTASHVFQVLLARRQRPHAGEERPSEGSKQRDIESRVAKLGSFIVNIHKFGYFWK